MIKDRTIAQWNDLEIKIYTLNNAVGSSVEVCNYGGIITSIKVPDKNGSIGEVTLGYADFDDYRLNDKYFGAMIGRFANRIAGGRFAIGGRQYAIPCNDGGVNLLHSGDEGFHSKVFEVDTDACENMLRLNYISPAGEAGFPGTLDVRISIKLTEDNTVSLEYRATADEDTIVNLTNHTYFNLAGHGDILGQRLMINAAHYTPVNNNLIPVGKIAPVDGTPLDFRTPTAIGERIADNCEQLKICGGYDHNYVIDGDGFRLAAIMEDESSGRIMEVHTDKPGMQFYSGNFLEDKPGRDGFNQTRNAACCFETQMFPDSPNHDIFPSCTLRVGEVYKYCTDFVFSVVK